MEHIAPLIQTTLWVALIGSIVWRYHKQFGSLLDAIQKRIESGSKIKAGPFELEETLRPQVPEQQRLELDRNISDVAESEPVGTQAPVTPSNSLPLQADTSIIRTRWLQAEDLALRAIQSEYGVPMTRQLQAGSDMQFDGFFAKNGTGHIVEVKYISRPNRRPVLEQTADKIFASVGRYGWRNIKLVIVLVYADDSIDLSKEKERFALRLMKYEGKVEVRCYHFNELAKQFGITA